MESQKAVAVDCGDGVEISVLVNGAVAIQRRDLTGDWQRIEKEIGLLIGDFVEIVVDPLENVDCDKTYLNLEISAIKQ